MISIIYILFSYFWYIGVFISEYEINKLKYLNWMEVVSALVAPISFPILLGIYMNQEK